MAPSPVLQLSNLSVASDGSSIFGRLTEFAVLALVLVLGNPDASLPVSSPVISALPLDALSLPPQAVRSHAEPVAASGRSSRRESLLPRWTPQFR